MMTVVIDKDKVASAFDRAAMTYDSVADIQQLSADHLIKMVGSCAKSINSILDIGCGTGSVAAKLHKNYPQASFDLCDISQNMLDVAQTKISSKTNLICADAEFYNFSNHYDLCISNLCVQWFESIEEFLKKISKSCSMFAFSTLIDSSFSQYKNCFEIPPTFRYQTAKELLSICKSMNCVTLYDIKTFNKEFENMFAVRRYFSKLGANVKSQEIIKLKSDIDLDAPIAMNYDIFFGCLEFDRDS